MLNDQNFTDSSSSNNMGAVAITIKSGFEDEVEINPYWTKIKVDELQGVGKPIEVFFSDRDSMPDLDNITALGNEETGKDKLTTFPMEFLLKKTDLMPNLESIPESKTSGELVLFMFTPANTLCMENLEKGSVEEIMDMFNDEEMIELIFDTGEDTLISFDAAMLVNVEENVKGMQTELYNSGESHHMLLY
jgi:hypothetical protein